MPVTIYGDGTLYGDADAIYGRISAELAAAQAYPVRETGLIVQVLDQRLNAWEHVAASELGWDYRSLNAGASIWSLEYYSYRGVASVCKLSNGNIIRVRIGSDSSSTDRQLYVQVVTDPLVASQWQSWSVLYSGNHFSCTVVPATASTYHVYHAKSDGLYKNNVKQWEPTAGQGLVLDWAPIDDADPDAGYARVIRFDETFNPHATRTVDLYFSSDITAVTPTAERTNFRWVRNDVAAAKLDDGRIARFQIAPYLYSPRAAARGHALWVQFRASKTDSAMTLPYVIRGIGGGGGKNWYSYLTLDKLSDGFYYLMMTETHQVTQGIAPSADIGAIPVWSRSKDLVHWTEPVVGPNGGKIAGMVEASDYVWWVTATNVWRRPATATTYDISNYVPQVSLELPRDNQSSTGQVKVANPDNVNNVLRTLADQEIIVKAGLKIPTSGVYEYSEFDRFWVKQVNQEVEGATNRLNLTVGNILDRLENPLKDVFNFLGQTEWDDWKVGKRNQPFNYFFESDTAPTVDDNFRLRSRGYVLWTGWKGLNFDLTVRLTSVSGNGSVIGRWVDKRNHLKLRKEGTTLRLLEVVDNVEVTVDTWTVTSDTYFTVRWVLEWGFYQVYINGVLEGSGTHNFDNYKPGYVGFHATSFKASQFHFVDLEYNLTMADLIRTALALGDVHDVTVAADSKAYAIIWGPQTDIQTAADGLRAALLPDKLQLVWRNGMLEVGKFNDPTVVKTIDNSIIESDRADEPNRRINYSIVDGNEHTWIALDLADNYSRGRSIVEYQDLPELMTQSVVTERAREAIRKSTLGASPGGTTPLFFDIYRMDHLLWIDNAGNQDVVRVEGLSIELDQGVRPAQRMTFDNSLIADNPSDIINEIVEDEEPQDPPEDPE